MRKASSFCNNDDTRKAFSSHDNDDTGSHYTKTDTHKDKQTTRLRIKKKQLKHNELRVAIFKQKKIINEEDYKILSEKIYSNLIQKDEKDTIDNTMKQLGDDEVVVSKILIDKNSKAHKN
ncbi:hypothetical protein ABK040_003465 [Willaertia magna]